MNIELTNGAEVCMKYPIDLSCLTEEEISQFQEDPYTLYNGDQDVALYLRYSSTGQSDQSIEGQLRDCRTIERISEPYIGWGGTVFVQTKRHSLP